VAVPTPEEKGQESAHSEMAPERGAEAVGLCTTPPNMAQMVIHRTMRASGTPSMAPLGGTPRTSLEKRQPQQPQRREPRGQELRALVLPLASSPKRKLGTDTRPAGPTMLTATGRTDVSLDVLEELRCLRRKSQQLVKSGPTRKRRPTIEQSKKGSELRPENRLQQFVREALEAGP
jgi:hypothetical protein